jgi:hypothetical protein
MDDDGEKEHPYIDFFAFYFVEIIYPIYRTTMNLKEFLEPEPEPGSLQSLQSSFYHSLKNMKEFLEPETKSLQSLLTTVQDLKNTTDDALPIYLNSIGFTQSHTLSDTRLVIGYSAFIICAATFYWDYKIGFEETKYYTAAAVAVYALLNGILTFWIWGVEKGTVYVGSKGGRKVRSLPHIPFLSFASLCQT